jgi:hypothetical protein
VIGDVVAHAGFGMQPELPGIPLDEIELWIPANDTLVSEVRRRTLDVLLRCSVNAGTVADAIVCVNRLASEAARRELSDVVGLRVTVLPSSIRIAVSERWRAPGQRGNRAPTVAFGLDPQTHRELDAVAARWGEVHEGGVATAWFELHAEDGPVAVRPKADQPGDGNDAGPSPATLSVLPGLTDALSSASDVTGISDAAALFVRRHLGAVFVGVALCDGDQMSFACVHPLPTATVAEWAPFPLSRNSPVAAACRNRTAYFHDTAVEAEAAFPGLGGDMRTAGADSIAHVPLIADGEAFGTLGVSWHAPRPRHDYRDVLRVVAEELARALKAARVSVAPPLRLTPSPDIGGALRQTPPRATAILTAGSMRINLITRAVSIRGRPPVALTGREFELLLHLVRNEGAVQSRRDLLRDVWGFDFQADTAVVEVTMSRLRRKLNIAELRTIKDCGYVFGPADPIEQEPAELGRASQVGA